MTFVKVCFLIMAVVASGKSIAIDYEDCSYRLEKLYREARNIRTPVESKSDHEDAISVISDIDHALYRAKKSCNQDENILNEICSAFLNISKFIGSQASIELCNKDPFRKKIGICNACIPTLNNK